MKHDQQTPDCDSAARDIRSIMEKLQSATADLPKTEKPQENPQQRPEEEKSASDTLPTSPSAEEIDPMVFLHMLRLEGKLQNDQEGAEAAVPTPAKKKTGRSRREQKTVKKAVQPAADDDRAPVSALPENQSPASDTGAAPCTNHPRKKDAVSEIVLKCILCISIITFLVSVCFLLYYMVIEPQMVKNNSAHYLSLYEDTATNQEEKSGYDYPAGMQPAFRRLYDINPDIAGWLSYVSTDSTPFLDIQQPVVHCGDNKTYLNRAFDGSKSRSGTLFFDKRNTFTKNASNRVTIIYGHNMASGLMFAKLNKLIGNVYYARCASQINLDTLYEKRQYQVFAVILCDEGAEPERYFSYLRTAFANDSDFLNYVQELRARSLFDYPVDVSAEDELLILSTCTAKSQAKVENGRLAVIARRVRADEDAGMNTNRIVENTDVIMPYAWYTAQNLTPHAFYTQPDYHLPVDSQATNHTGTTATTAKNADATTATNAVATSATTTVHTGTTAKPVNDPVTDADTTTTTSTTVVTTETTVTTTETTTDETTISDETTTSDEISAKTEPTSVSTTTTEGANT